MVEMVLYELQCRECSFRRTVRQVELHEEVQSHSESGHKLTVARVKEQP